MKNIMTRLAVLACFAAVAANGAEPLRLPIWEKDAPLADGKFEKAAPTITVHLPDPAKANGLAMVICPGGGYGTKVLGGEGHGVARWLNAQGMAGVVLDYRLPRGDYHRPLLDAQRAIRLVRANAKEWKINPAGIGIIGFSAGGHLASTAGTHFDAGNPKSEDKVEQQSCRPDFMVLVYPVISMGPKSHGGSRNNFLGPAPTPELVDLFSNEKQVTKATPPAFLTHGATDSVVSVENSRMFFAALQAQQVPAELLEFPQGNHGYSGYRGKEWDGWQKRCAEWLAERYKLKRAE